MARPKQQIGECLTCGAPVLGVMGFSTEPDIFTCKCHDTKESKRNVPVDMDDYITYAGKIAFMVFFFFLVMWVMSAFLSYQITGTETRIDEFFWVSMVCFAIFILNIKIKT